MSELDTQLAALAAAAQAQAAILVAEAKAKENAATFTTSSLTDAELSDKATSYEAAVGTSEPHPAIPHLYAMVKHLFSAVADLRAQLVATDTTVATGYSDQQAYDATAVAATPASSTVMGSSGSPTASGYVASP